MAKTRLWCLITALVCSSTQAHSTGPTPGSVTYYLEVDYDTLAVGQSVPDWVPIERAGDLSTPVVRLDAALQRQVAEVDNDWEVRRLLPGGVKLQGLVVIEIWMRPNTASVNNFLRPLFGEDGTGGFVIMGKNDGGQWMYNSWEGGGHREPFAPVEPDVTGEVGRRSRIEIDTETNEFSVFFDSNANDVLGDADDYCAVGVPYDPFQAGRPVVGVTLNSGRGLSGAPSQFHSLRIGVLEPNCQPVVTGAYADPGSLWPPNGRMEEAKILGITDCDGDDIAITITGISDDEDNDPADHGGIGTDTALVRVERDGQGEGRTYTLSFTADDDVNAPVPGEVTIRIPHDRAERGSGRAKRTAGFTWGEVKRQAQ